MKTTIVKSAEVKYRTAASFPRGSLLINSASSGLFVRFQSDTIIGFDSHGAHPWIFEDDGKPIWLLAPEGTKIVLEQE